MGLAEEIAELEAVLAAGATAISADGVSAQFDLDEVRRQLNDKKRQLDRHARPRAFRIRLSGGYD